MCAYVLVYIYIYMQWVLFCAIIAFSLWLSILFLSCDIFKSVVTIVWFSWVISESIFFYLCCRYWRLVSCPLHLPIHVQYWLNTSDSHFSCIAWYSACLMCDIKLAKAKSKFKFGSLNLLKNICKLYHWSWREKFCW